MVYVVRAELRVRDRSYVTLDVAYYSKRSLESDERVGFPNLINMARDLELIYEFEMVDQVRYTVLSENVVVL
jgi:hypothetical protein